MTDYSKIVRNDDEPQEDDDGFEYWRDNLSEHDYNQHAVNYIETGGRNIVGVVKQDWINAHGVHQAAIQFDMEADFQDLLYGYYKKVILPNLDTGFVEPD
jgi:hypothetical protein